MNRRNIIHILAALSLGAVLAGCSVLPEDPVPQQEGCELQFTASVGTYQVKATDTAFETGDAIGLYAYSPIDANNMRLEWSGNSFKPESPIMWVPGMELPYMHAYYPYRSSGLDYTDEFRVQSDQSTHAGFTASDFMYGQPAEGSEGGTVNLVFEHRFSKLVMYLDSALDEPIQDVYLSNVYGVAKFYNSADALFGYYTIGNTGTIKTGKVMDATGAVAWAVIVPAQYCQPRIIVTTESGKQYNFDTASSISFDAGCSYKARLSIDDSSEYTDFTTEVTEWTSNSDIAFRVYREWGIVGSFSGWMDDYSIGYDYDTTIDAMFEYYAGQAFKFRWVGDWSFNYGIGEWTEEGSMAGEGTYDLVHGGGNILLPVSGIWNVSLDLLNERVTFTLLQEYETSETDIWTGNLLIDNWNGLTELAYGSYDWSFLEPGQVLNFYFTMTADASYYMIRIADGTWMPLPGMLANYPDLEGDYMPDYGTEHFSLTLTQEDVANIIENGLVVTGNGFTLTRISLSTISYGDIDLDGRWNAPRSAEDPEDITFCLIFDGGSLELYVIPWGQCYQGTFSFTNGVISFNIDRGYQAYSDVSYDPETGEMDSYSWWAGNLDGETLELEDGFDWYLMSDEMLSQYEESFTTIGFRPAGTGKALGQVLGFETIFTKEQ